ALSDGRRPLPLGLCVLAALRGLTVAPPPHAPGAGHHLWRMVLAKSPAGHLDLHARVLPPHLRELPAHLHRVLHSHLDRRATRLVYGVVAHVPRIFISNPRDSAAYSNPRLGAA